MNYWWSAFLFRIVLPLVILTAVCFRPSITSSTYLLMGLYNPFFSVPTAKTMAGSTRTFMKMLMVISLLNYVLIVSFYFCLCFPIDEEFQLEPCSAIETAIRTLGVVRLEGLSFADALPWILPENLMLGTSVVLYFTFKKLCQDSLVTRAAEALDEEALEIEINRQKMLSIMLVFGRYLAVGMLCLTAIMKASLFGFIYYLVFLVVITIWAFNKTLGKALARILICLIPIISLNITIIFCYQLQYLQDHSIIDPESLLGRLFNLVDLRAYRNCTDPRIFHHPSQTKSNYGIPICLFILYHLAVLISREILEAKDGFSQLLVALFKRDMKFKGATAWEMALRKSQKKAKKGLADTSPGMADQIKTLVEQFMMIITSISYLVANFIMMVWAVTYVGWKTLILLIWANVLWLFPWRKKMLIITSPFLVAWMWFLLITNYLYSIELTPKELPPKMLGISFASGVYVDQAFRWIHLLTQSLFGIIIFVALRQLWQEIAFKKLKQTSRYLEEDPVKSKQVENLQAACMRVLAFWWIWVVIIMMIWIEFWAYSSMFNIVFVVLAVVFLITFQLCPFDCWKKFLKFYWWIVIVYAMVNLFVIFMYQIGHIRNVMHKFFNPETFSKIGFKNMKLAKDRTQALLIPLFFQTAVVIQNSYLQEEFNKQTSLSSPEEVQIEEEEQATSGKKIRTALINTKNVVFKVLEVHLQNLLLLVCWYMCVFDLCAIFLICVLLLTFSSFFGRTVKSFIIYFISCMVQILIVFRLIYMNQYSEHLSWNYVGHYERNGKPFNKTLNTLDWIGFHQSKYGTDYADFNQLSLCFIFVFLVTVHRVVTIRMWNYRISGKLPTDGPNVLFPEITYKNCNENVSNLLKYLANYGFYKFGCEITFVFATIAIALRMDIEAIVVCTFLLLMFAMNRRWLSLTAPSVLVICAFWVPWQYANTLGTWPTSWEKTLTRYWNYNDYRLRLQHFCHLSNLAHPPVKEKISLDFWLMLLISRQCRVHKKEQLQSIIDLAGSNEDVSEQIDLENVSNPVPDFITYTRSHLDIFKRIFFTAWFYLAIFFTFLAGTTMMSVLSYGYILFAFIALWEGTDIFLRPPKSLLRRWNVLIAYTILMITIRAVSQIFGCILIYERDIKFNCALLKVFTVACLDKFKVTEGVPNTLSNKTCDIHLANFDIYYDCLCFFFLIFQQRIFKSYHFLHMVNEIKAQTILADRGAVYIEEKRHKKRLFLDTKESIIRNNIEKKMEKIRETHLRMQKDAYLRRKKNHRQMVKSSDYYMFSLDMLKNDIHLMPPTEDKEEQDRDRDPYDPPPILEYFAFLNETDIPTVLAERDLRRRQKDAINEGRDPNELERNPRIGRSYMRKSKHLPEQEIEPTKMRRLLNMVLIIWGAFESFIVSITALINYMSRDFREILSEMNKDRQMLKKHTNYHQGVRLGENKVWHPIRSYTDVLNNASSLYAEPDESGGSRVMEYSIYLKLLLALWYLIMTNSEWTCYLLIILNKMLGGNFLSIPLAVIMFCWGSLTVPKPSKTFWVVVIAYILVMLFVKCVFGMHVIPWNQPSTAHQHVFFPPNIIGISSSSMAGSDVTLLMALFFHRVVLQKLGLWKSYKYRSAVLIEDGDYNLKYGHLVPLSEKNKRQANTLNIMNQEVMVEDYFPKSILQGCTKYAEAFKMFVQQLISPSSTQIPVDVYTPMFLCDLVNIFILIFFYGSFESGEQGGIINFIQENRVPMSFIRVVLVYFMCMVVDRAIYMRRNRYAKLFFHFFLVIGFLIWCFILFPTLTDTVFTDSPVVQVFYLFKSFYFLFSAYQIRNGYPALISFSMFWKGTTVFNKFGYKFVKQIPYFFEMRTLLDWICSDSCLGVNDWFKMEEITQNCFDQRCEQDYEKQWSQPAGQPKKRSSKYVCGGTLYFLLILTVIFPFLLFSLGDTVGVATHPAKIKIEVYMGSAEPIFQSYASEKNVKVLSEDDYRKLTSSFNNIRESEEIFGSYRPEDVVVYQWLPHSLTTWRVSPGTVENLISEISSDEPLKFRVEIHYTHIGHGGNKVPRIFSQSVSVPPKEERKDLIDALTKSNSSYKLPLIFPKFLQITNEAESNALPIMEIPEQNRNSNETEGDPRRFRNLELELLNNDSGEIWWHIREECSVEDESYLYYLKDLVHNKCKTMLVMYTFNEKVFSDTMSYITQSGILGLYLLYFMMVISTIRDCCITAGEIWMEDLPDSDDLMRKCLEVYVARDMQNYELEEELFSQLIFIMRSKEVLIRMTRSKDNEYNPPILEDE